jgi:hypothetical protein
VEGRRAALRGALQRGALQREAQWSQQEEGQGWWRRGAGAQVQGEGLSQHWRRRQRRRQRRPGLVSVGAAGLAAALLCHCLLLLLLCLLQGAQQREEGQEELAGRETAASQRASQGCWALWLLVLQELLELQERPPGQGAGLWRAGLGRAGLGLAPQRSWSQV